jgi:ribosomal protein S18 acetylase RimI-like enzyme
MTENKTEKIEIKFTLTQTFGGARDIADLIQIEEDVIVGLGNNRKIYSGATSIEDWNKEFTNESNKIFFIEVDGKNVGSLMFEEKEDEILYVAGVAILPEYQGKGIVKNALKEKLSELMKDKKHKRVYLLTHPENPAKKLYESLSFFDTGNVVENYDGVEPRIIMDLKLN